jgi:RNA polymerase sigma factor (sigma-70 family)
MKKLEPPTHLEPMYLYNKYEPLRKAMYNRFKDKMSSNADREELHAVIGEMFLQLVSEFDPSRGVDFPYYIKRMLNHRTWHYVDKYLKVTNKETYEDEFIIEDESYEEIFDRIIDLHSIDPGIELGEKHRNLMIGVLIHKKTLKEMADEEGVPVERLHARLYFLLKKMREVHEKHKEQYGEDLY